MIIELGHSALILALMVALLGAALPLLARTFATPTIMRLSLPITLLQALLIFVSFGTLIYAYAVSDFTVVNVILNSHSDKPLIYKISGAWGNHEGSMMLWISILSLYGLMVSFTRIKDADLTQRALVVLSAVNAGFIAFILFTSNPFLRTFPAAANGDDLNPLLQDIGLAMHPPMLYMGYVGFGMVFAFAVAALWRGEVSSAWARIVQPWILMAWGTLTLGIGLGSWWAYRELGWGGWWFWDPVENVSLLPWLTGTALLHSNLVLEKRGAFGRWVLLLSILTFAMSLMGTFIVRSGLITSVHAFASDPTRGMFILGYVGCVVGLSLLLYARKYIAIERIPFQLSSREGGILANNILLVTFALTILIAILYPVFLTLTEQPTITVGPPYFNALFIPFAFATVLIAGLSPLLPWQRTNAKSLRRALIPLLLSALISGAVALMILDRDTLFAVIGIMLSAWMFAGTFMHARRRWNAIAMIEHDSFIARLRRFPASAIGTLLSHTGVAILAAAITISSVGKERFETPIKQGAALELGDYILTITKAEKITAGNYDARRATFDIAHAGKHIATLAPEIRYYPVRGMQTSEVALSSTLWRDVYLVMGEAVTDGGISKNNQVGIRLYIMPGMMFLWIGFGLIAAGGGVSFFVRIRNHMQAPPRPAGAL